MTNEQKRGLAYRLLGEKGCHPEHQCPSGQRHPKGRINDSHLCHFFDIDVLVSVKYVDTRGKIPGIGFYWRSKSKHNYLEDLMKLQLPTGFYLDEKSITANQTGWVMFCRNKCNSADDMYNQIVDPGTALKPWQDLFKTMVSWGQKKFGYSPRFYPEERWCRR